MSEEVIVDSTFGVLTWNEHLQWWAGNAELTPGYHLRVYIESTQLEGNERLSDLARARRLWGIISRTDVSLRRKAAVEGFWEMYDDWREGVNPPRPKLDLKGFLIVFKLKSVTFYADGIAELFLDDALDVFGGHALHFIVDSDGNYEAGSVMFSG